MGVAPLSTTATPTTSVIRVIYVKPKARLHVDRKGQYIPTLRVIQKSLRAKKSEKVKQDSALRDVSPSGESYPDMTYRVDKS